MAAHAEQMAQDHANRAAMTGDDDSISTWPIYQVLPTSRDTSLKVFVGIPADAFEVTLLHSLYVFGETFREERGRSIDPRETIDLNQVGNELWFNRQSRAERACGVDRPALAR